MPTLSEPTTQAIPQTHCMLCDRQINGDKPRICCICMTDDEKLTAQYGANYADILGDSTEGAVEL